MRDPLGPPAAPAISGPQGPATLYGTVVEVPDLATAVVDVDGQPVQVAILGIDASQTLPCARPDALAFARDTIGGQQVTLVPDPTVAAPRTDSRRAYLVLASQLSYTDAAILAGWAAPGGPPALYRAVFDNEAREARTAARGMWSPTC